MVSKLPDLHMKAFWWSQYVFDLIKKFNYQKSPWPTSLWKSVALWLAWRPTQDFKMAASNEYQSRDQMRTMQLQTNEDCSFANRFMEFINSFINAVLLSLNYRFQSVLVYYQLKQTTARLIKILIWHLYREVEDYNVCSGYRIMFFLKYFIIINIEMQLWTCIYSFSLVCGYVSTASV